MADEPNEFNAEEASRHLSERKRDKVVRTISVGGLNLVPYVGGTLATLLQEILPDWKSKRIYEFLEQFGRDHEKMKEKLNQTILTTAEHGLLIESVVRKVTRTSDKDNEKLRAFRAIMVNSCMPSTPGKMERDIFLGWVDRLQEIHIILVSLCRDPDDSAARYGFTRSQYQGTLSITFSQYLQKLQISEELFRAAILELDNLGILPGSHGRLNAMTSRPSELHSQLSGIGRRFADFIALPPELHDRSSSAR
jgi:hypothetical protein